MRDQGVTMVDQWDEGWLTLTEAAARSGYSREALRLRVRRGKLKSSKGNDGTIRVLVSELVTLPPPEAPADDTADDQGDVQVAAIEVLRSTVDDLRSELNATRSALETARSDLLADRGRAERAGAEATAEKARAERAEARLTAVEAALEEARTPLVVRLVRAFRSGRS